MFYRIFYDVPLFYERQCSLYSKHKQILDFKTSEISLDSDFVPLRFGTTNYYISTIVLYYIPYLSFKIIQTQWKQYIYLN